MGKKQCIIKAWEGNKGKFSFFIVGSQLIMPRTEKARHSDINVLLREKDTKAIW